MEAKRRSGDRTESGYNQTPVSPFYSEEERRRLQARIPHGVHPRMKARGHKLAKASYYVPPVVIPADAVHPYERENFATRVVAGIPHGPHLEDQRAYWERTLLEAYFHLYGDSWARWAMLIPWIPKEQIGARAQDLSCEPLWGWTARRQFLVEQGLAWSLEDLNYLIDRYPDRQENSWTRGIFVSDRPFSEIQRLAAALNLPTKEVLATLMEYAQKLNVGGERKDSSQ